MVAERAQLARTVIGGLVCLLLIPVALDSAASWRERRRAQAAAREHTERATAAMSEGQLGQAELAARAALDLVPRDPAIRRELMRIQAIRVARSPQILEGRDLDGLRYALTVLGAYDGTAGDEEVFVAAGHLAAHEGDTDASLELYRAAVTRDEDSAAAHLALGGLYRRAGNDEDAVKAYEAALAADPKSLKTANDLGVQLVDMGQLDRGVEMFERAIGIEDNAASRVNLGNALLGLGKLDEALEHLRRATALAPNSASAWARLGSALLDAKQPAEALDALNRSLALAPSSTTLLHAARAHQSLGRHGTAIEMIGQIGQSAADGPAPIETPYYLARSLEAIGESQGAASAYRQFLSTAEAVPSQKERVAHAKLRLGGLAQAGAE